MTAVGRALIEQFDEDDLRGLAHRLAPHWPRKRDEATHEPDRWLDAKAAASYLGITTNALHKRTSAREIPFEQEGPGCKLWFKQSELDAWRRGEPAARFQNASKRPR